VTVHLLYVAQKEEFERVVGETPPRGVVVGKGPHYGPSRLLARTQETDPPKDGPKVPPEQEEQLISSDGVGVCITGWSPPTGL
jgi:hypothetical protein